MSFKVPEKYRCNDGLPAMFHSTSADGNNGFFLVPFESTKLVVMASDGLGWEHVSVSLQNRTPNWREMCFIKEIFWGDEDCVIQYHPPKSQYVNRHEHCLHLWRQVGKEFPLPPKEMVG